MGLNDAKQCPWCKRWCLKDNACAYIFACGLDDKNVFHVGLGCGKSWCWTCGKKYCSQYYDPLSGKMLPDAKNHHTARCCKEEQGFKQEDYCPGGHSSHCGKRWET
jgi:hypothetical protein